MPLSFVLSQKGKKNLLHKNYLYREYYRGKNFVSWRCVYFDKNKCTAKVHTTSDKKCGTVIEKGDQIVHNHVLEMCDIQSVKVKNKIKKMASKTSESSMNIVGKCTTNICASTSSILPLNKSLCRNIQRQRVKILGGPALPTDVHSFIVPEMYQKSMRDEMFLYYDYNQDGKRILIYTTENNLKVLKKCKIWQGDGTFDTVPNIFDQLYTIHGRYKKNLIPLVYILTTDRKTETYKIILEKLIELQQGLNPSLFIVDFEMSFIKAFECVFPECDIHGCYFHWCQCVWRHIQSCGMQERYQNDQTFSYHIRKLLALSFVKPDDVKRYYETLIKSEYFVENKDYLKPLLEYFEPTWIQKVGRLGRMKAPKFPIELWNCFDCVVDDLPRTNNAIEGWHRGFSSKLNCSHASLWKFLYALQVEQSFTENKISDIIAKKIVPITKDKYVKLNERILKIVSDYDNSDVDEIEYLESLALNIRL